MKTLCNFSALGHCSDQVGGLMVRKIKLGGLYGSWYPVCANCFPRRILGRNRKSDFFIWKVRDV